MRKHLASSHWAQEYSVLAKTGDIEVMWTTLKSKLLELQDKYVPLQTTYYNKAIVEGERLLPHQ